MFNKLLFMSNSFFGRFKKRDNKVVEEHLPIREDRIFWVETLQKIAFLEAFANVFNGIAPWLELGPDESEEGRLREKYILLTLKAIGNAVDSNNNDYIIFTENKQSLMSIALFAQGLLRSKTQIWNNLSESCGRRL